MIRMAMVGCGGMAAAYMRQMETLGDRLRFTAVVDLDIERARAATAASPVAADAVAVTDYREIYDTVDAAVLAVPHHTHQEIALGFIGAGKHVLIEKPLATTERACLEVIAAADTAGITAMHGYVMRYSPIVGEFGRLLRERTYGDCFQLSIWTEQYTDLSRGPWVGQLAGIGGGQLFSHGCHYIDLLLHWLGTPVKGSHLGTNRGTPWMEMEGTSNVVMEFASGATAYHFGTWGARGSKLRYSFHAHCTDGMIELDYANRRIVLWRDPSHGDLGGMSAEDTEAVNERPRSRVLHEAADNAKHTAAEVGHFLDCIEQQRTPETDLRSGLQSLRAIWRLYDAETRGIVADLRGLGLDEFSPAPDPILARQQTFGYTCDAAILFGKSAPND